MLGQLWISWFGGPGFSEVQRRDLEARIISEYNPPFNATPQPQPGRSPGADDQGTDTLEVATTASPGSPGHAPPHSLFRRPLMNGYRVVSLNNRATPS